MSTATHKSKRGIHLMKKLIPALLLTANFLTTADAANISNDLTAHWKLDGDALDSSGNGHNATVNGGATFVPGVVGQAVSLDGADDHLRISTDVLMGTEFTIAAWIQPGSHGSLSQIFSKGSTGETAAANAKQLRLENGELKLLYEYDSGSDYTLASSWVAPLNQWAHVVGARDANGTTYLYVNGSLHVQELSTALPNTNSPVTNIGQREGGTELYHGFIDELRIYSRALSEQEVATLYNESKTVSLPSSITLTNQPANLPVGALFAEQFGEEITEESFAYTLVTGEGDTNNALFSINDDGTLVTTEIIPEGSPTSLNFTNAGATGRQGPSQAQVDAEYTGTELEGNVTATATGIQQWTVPATGTYRIETYGAQGAVDDPADGRGAIMKGDFELEAGATLWILVGQTGQGVYTSYEHLSGGGGTFVAIGPDHATSEPLIISGGGGAHGAQGTALDSGGSITTSGNAGYNGGEIATNNAGGTNGGAGSEGGKGFNDPVSIGMDPAAGWLQGGTTSQTFHQGGLGADADPDLISTKTNNDGGFGGGSALRTSESYATAGGGGGYSGGGSSDSTNGMPFYGGGGGSYNVGLNQDNTPAANPGHGKVVITQLDGGGDVDLSIRVQATSEGNTIESQVSLTALFEGGDNDGDLLTNAEEVALGTDPLLADTDGDGLEDGKELELGLNPLLEDRPYAFWPFDTLNDDTFTNYGYAANGDLILSNPTGSNHATGAINNALQLDGGTDFLGTSVAQPNYDAFSVSLWVNTNTPNTEQKIIGNMQLSSGGWSLGITSDNNLYLEFNDTGSTYHNDTMGNIPGNEWVHLSMVWNAGDYLTGYINGVEVINRDLTGVAMGTNHNPIRVGAAAWDNTQFHYSGMLDDIRIYDRALTAAEIEQLSILQLPPEAEATTYFTAANVPLTVTLTATDVNGDPITYEVTDTPAVGTLTSNTETSYTYLAPEGFEGTETLNFTASDQTGSSSATITINVVVPPVAVSSEETILQNQTALIPLNIINPDDEPLYIKILEIPENGTLYQTPDGQTRGTAITQDNTVLDSSAGQVIFVPGVEEFGENYATIRYQILPGGDPLAEIPEEAKTTDPDFPTGRGTLEEPYQIESLSQLISFQLSGNKSKHYELTANIDASAYTWNSIPEFSGTFEGNGFSIYNLTIEDGCFITSLEGASTEELAEIRNLGLVDVHVKSESGAAPLVMAMRGNSVVTNCFATGNVQGQNSPTSGLIGFSYAESGQDLPLLQNSWSAANVVNTTSLDNNGGIAGEWEFGLITNCYFGGSIEASSPNTGGLVGTSSAGTITNCYSFGRVLLNGGGLIGAGGTNTSNSFWDTTASGKDTSAAGTGLPTVDIHDSTTYTNAGWEVGADSDGDGVFWTIDPKLNCGYPFLSHQTIHHVCADASVIIHVIVVNDPPYFTSTPPATATEEQDFLYNLSAEDPEGDTFTFSGVSLPGWLSVDNFEGAVLYGTPQNTDVGSYTITLEVTDSEGNSSQQVFELLVIDVNDLPVTTDATETVDEDVPTLITLPGSDPDEDPLTYVITELPANGTLYQTVDGELLGEAITQPNTLLSNTNGDLYFVTDQDENGQNYTTFKFQVMDGAAKAETDDTASTVATKPSGDGTGTNPYQISILGHLSWLTQNNDQWDAHYIQTANIDAAATKYWDDADDNADGDKYNDPADITTEGQNEGFHPIGSQYTVIFTGDYDGRGNSILELTINRGDRANIGLFGKVENATIRSLGLVDANITGNANVGALVGILQDSTVENSFSTGTVTGELSGAYSENIGGLVGQMVGNSSNATIAYSWSGAHVHNPVSNGGGLVGLAKDDAYISQSFANGSVSGDGTTNGGLAGSFSGTEVDQTYSLTDLSEAGEETGGLFGAVSVTADNSFWDTESSSISTSPAGVGQTSSELQTQATFGGWNFTDANDGVPYWKISSIANDGFPYLNWQKVVSLSNESTVTIHATAVSDPPYLSSPSTASTEEDSSKTISISASDPEGDAISFDVTSGDENVTVSVSGTAPSIDIDLIPAPNWFGTAEIFVTANDGTGGSSTDIILFTVTSVNDLPVPLDDHKNTNEDTPVSITLEAIDVESEPITFIINDLPEHGTLYQTENGTDILSAISESGTIVSNSQGTVIYAPDADVYGDQEFDAFTFAVADPNVEPELTTGPEELSVIHQPAMTTPYGAAYYGGKGYIAAQGDNKVYEIDPEDGSSAVVIDGAVLGKTIQQIATSANGDLYVFYNGTNEVIHKFTYPYDHNSPILIGQKLGNTVEHAVIDHSNTYLYMVDSSDVIQRIKTDTTEQVSTPWTTVTSVLLRSIAMDSNGDIFASQSLGEIYKIPVIEGNPGTPVNFATANTYGIAIDGADNLWVSTHSQATILKIDPEGEITTFSPQGLVTPHYIAINEDASLFFVADWDLGKGVVLGITAGPLSLNSAEVTIDVLPINDEPTIGEVTNQTTEEDTPLTISLEAFDPDADDLTFSASSSANVSATVEGSTLDLAPASNWHGTESITVSISDGNGGSDSTSFNITVTPVDDAPTLGGVSVITGDEDVPFPISKPGSVTTIAGNGTLGFAEGVGTNAQFNHPTGILVDGDGNLFVSDYQNHRIRKITPDGTVSTFAGSGSAGSVEGNGTSASFHTPSMMTWGPDGDIFLAEGVGNVVRRITPAGDATILAGIPGGGATVDGSISNARFNGPNGIAYDPTNNYIYVSEYNAHVIRRIDLNFSDSDVGFVTTIAGSPGAHGYVDGAGANARLWSPWGLDVDSNGNVYVAEYGGQRIRKITPDGNVSLVAGNGVNAYLDGTTDSASFNNPWHALVYDDNTLYVGENSARLRKIDLLTNQVTTLFGQGSATSIDGSFDVANAAAPSSLYRDGDSIYFTSYSNHNVRVIEFGSELIATEVDGEIVTVNLAVNTGILALTQQGNTSITAGANETANLSIQGSVEDVNAALNTLHYIGPQDFLGEDTLTYSISDGTTTTDNATATIVVENVPDAPVLDEIGYQETEEDSSISITLSAFDADEDDLTFSAVVNSGDVSADISGAQLTISPETDWYGSGVITVTVDDGNGGTDSEAFEFFVIPVNDVPSSANGSITVAEDTVYSFSVGDFTYSDDDGDALYKLRLQSSTAGTLWIDADGNNVPNESPVADNTEILLSNLQQLKFLPGTNDFGEDYATFSFEVSDGQDYSSSHLMTIHVSPVEDTPVAYTINSLSKLNIPQSVVLAGSDPEETDLTFTINSLPEHGQLFQTTDGIASAAQISAVDTNVDRLVPASGIGVLNVSPPVDGSDTIDLSDSSFSGFEPGVEYTIVSTTGSITVDVQMWGAGGGNGSYNGGADGGGGGMSTGKVVLEWNTPYKLIVGTGGQGTSPGSGGEGGIPGGGYGTLGDASGAGGGGYTGLFINSVQHANSILIAGGGGGATDYSGGGNAGAGGGLNGQNGNGGAQGGSQTAGGNATSGGVPGSELQGGNGDSRGGLTTSSYDGGGGGGGYYGGEGGISDARPGAGGSGFVHPLLVTEGATHTGNYSLPAQNTSLPSADYAYGAVNSGQDGKPGFLSISFVEGTTAQGANLIYVPDEGYVGEDSFSYIVTDEANQTAESTVITETFEPQVAFSDFDSATFSGGSASWLQINPLPVTEDFTIQFWMKTTDPGGTNDPAAPGWSNGHGLVDADMPENQYDFGISLLDRGIAFGVGNPEAEEVNVYSSSTVDHDEWFHVAATRNASTGEIKLYIDGALEDHAIGTMEPLQASTRLVIGQLQTLTGAYAGEIADLRIHNTVRSETQIIEDANNITDTSEPSLIGHYTFTELGEGIAGGGHQPWDMRNRYLATAFGQDTAITEIPRDIANEDLRQVAVGQDYALALTSGGAVLGWGDNTEGQINIPVEATYGVRQIAASHQVAYALKNDGTVIAWGKDDGNRLDTTGLTNIVKIADQNLTALFLDENGKVHIRSTGDLSISDVSGWATGVQDIASSPLANLAVIDGEAVVIGSTNHGLNTVPEEAKSDVISVHSQENTLFVQKMDGSVIAWGNNSTNLTSQLATLVLGTSQVRFDGGVDADHQLVLSTGGNAISIDPGLDTEEYNQSVYFITPNAMTWHDAEAWAVSQGGHLASVEDAEEQTFLAQTFNFNSFWIGLYRVENSWDSAAWSNGSTSTYRNWSPGEPNGPGPGGEPATQMHASGTWNDLNDQASLFGIVEISHIRKLHISTFLTGEGPEAGLIDSEGKLYIWGSAEGGVGELPPSVQAKVKQAEKGPSFVVALVPDNDGDHLPDIFETETGTFISSTDTGTSPANPDEDQDGILDGDEVRLYESDPFAVDTDSDGLEDALEITLQSNLNSADTDSDSFTDAHEHETGTDLLDPNEFPESYGVSPLNLYTDTTNDSDGDGLTDGEEINLYDTDPNDPDIDGDGLNDSEEIAIGTNPYSEDSDGDTFADSHEHATGTDPLDGEEVPEASGLSPINLHADTTNDSDGDGLTDGEEIHIYETNPEHPDVDEDELTDAEEVMLGTNPYAADSDQDTFTDGYEYATGTNPLDPDEVPEALNQSAINIHADTTNDSDGDGLTDGEEINIYDTNPEHPDVDEDGLTDKEEVMLGTNPYEADSDQDSFTDGYEYSTGTDPLDPDEVPEGSNQSALNLYADTTNDSDSDGLTDGEEVNIYSTNPDEADSDEDGLSDALELDLGTDPNLPDSDDDTFTDAHEFTTGTNPLDPGEYPESANESPLALFADTTNDTDEDGLTDGEETHIYGTNPNLADSDSDGLSDSEELTLGTNPGDTDSDNDGSSDADELEFETDPLNPESFLVSISGAITYEGQFEGSIYLVIERDADAEPITELFEEPGNFLISNLQNHYQYKVWAFMDLNSDKDYQQDEPFGALHADFTTLTEDLVEQVIHLRDTNAPPEDILLSNTTIEENAPSATLVGTLTAVDPDEDDSFTFSLVDGNDGEVDNHLFTIDGNNIYTTESFDYETTPVLDIVVQVQDSYGETVTASFIIDVTNLFSAILSTNLIEEGDSASFIASGSVLGDGGAEILQKGILYGRSPGLSAETDKATTVSSEDTSESEILVTLSGLTPNRKYYFRTFAENSEGLAYGPERSFITADVEVSSIWANATELTGGWYSLEEFGNFYLQESPWIYHEALGWLYAVEDETDGVWLWNNQLGWCWTKFDFYPYLWKDNSNSWVYYLLTNETDRVFYNATENLLENYPLQ